MYADVKIDDVIDDEKTSTMIKNLYSTGQFAKVDIELENDVLIFDIIENLTIGKIYVDGSAIIDFEKIKDQIQTKERGIYSKAIIKEDVMMLQAVMQNLGYNLSIVEPKIVIRENKSVVDIVFEVNQGDRSSIRKFNFYGLKGFTKDELLKILRVKESGLFFKGTDYDQGLISRVKESIIKYYNENGYPYAKIENLVVQFSRDSSDVLIDLYLSEGARYKISNILIDESVMKLSSGLKVEDLGIKQNVYYNKKILNIAKDKVYNNLYKNANGNVNINYKIENTDNNNLDIRFIAEVYEPDMVRNITIVGQKKTKDFIIRRELLVSEGSSILDKDIERSKNRLMSLGYFKKIEINKSKVSGSNSVDLTVEIEEDERRSSINAQAGYSDFEKGLIGVNLNLPNIKGTGYDFDTSFMMSKISKNFGVGLSTARFGQSKFGGGLNLGYSVFDPSGYYGSAIKYRSESYYISPTLSYRMGDNLFYYFTYSYSKTNMENSQTGTWMQRSLVMDQFKNTTTSSISNAIYYDTRDNFILPTTGSRIGGGQTIAGLGGNQNFIKHDFEATKYYRLFGNSGSMPLKIAFHGGNVQSMGGDVLFQNRYNVWYFNMRGFGYGGLGPRFQETSADGSQVYHDYISYRANTYGIFTLQQHFPVPFSEDSGARWYMFSDFAMAKGFDGVGYKVNSSGNTEQILDSSRIRNASGFGIEMPTPFGVVSLDYSAYVSALSYDNVQRFRISIGGMPLM